MKVLPSSRIAMILAALATTTMADAPAETPPTDQAATQRIDTALKRGADLIAQKDFAAVRAVYEETVRALATGLPAESDAGQVVARGVSRLKDARDDRNLANVLAFDLAEARAALNFKPTLEAELPEGFPQPGPVGKVVIKDYPAYRMARTSMSAKPDDDSGSFWTLFNHIKANDIAMTAPVEMNLSEDKGVLKRESMAFLYRTPTLGKTMKSDAVEVLDMPAVKVLSIGIRGSDTPDKIAEAKQKLQAEFEAKKTEYEVAGGFRYLGYNSPFILPWLRFGELQLPVRARTGK